MSDATTKTRVEVDGEPADTSGDLALDLGRRQAIKSGRVIELPRLSFRLFAALAEAAPNVLTHQDLVDRVWNGRPVSAETIIQRVMLVRRSLGDDAGNPRYIGLVRGQGYRMLQPVRILPKGSVPDRDRDTGLGQRILPRRNLWATARRRAGPFLTITVGIVGAVMAALMLTPLLDRDPAIEQPAPRPIVAILPFGRAGTTEDDGILANGIQDDIVTSLAGVESLRVASRASVEKYRGSGRSALDIGRDLGADVVLSSELQQDADRILLNFRLIDVNSGEMIWSGSFDGILTVENLFAARSHVASAIAQSMRVALSGGKLQQTASAPTNNLNAYLAYLRGAQLLRRRTGATIASAILSFQDAIRLDGEFALPYIGLADGYQLMLSYSSGPANVVLPRALEAAKRAIALDSASGAAYASLAMIHFEALRRRDAIIEAADPEPLFQRALRLDPNYATAYQWYGEYLSALGREDEAAAMYERGLAIDPASPILNHVYAATLASLDRDDAAEMRFLKALDIDPGFARAYQGLAAFYFRKLGRVGDAARQARRSALLNPADATNFALLANIYMHLGDDERAAHWLSEANRLQPDSLYSSRITALLHLYRGDLKTAISVAQSALVDFPRDPTLINIAKSGYLADGRVDAALAMYVRAFPWLGSAGSAIPTKSGNRIAIDYARLLQEAGRNEEAEAWLRSSQETLSRILPAENYNWYVLQAAVHSLNTDSRRALDSIRRAVDMGWRKETFYHFDYDPNFDSIRQDPEFQSIAEEVRIDLANQHEQLLASASSAAGNQVKTGRSDSAFW